MELRVTKRIWVVLLIAGFVSLGGCLTDEGRKGELTNKAPDNNGTPTISGNPDSAVKIGDSYSFTPTASDPDGDTLTFSVQNKPIWAAFDEATGRLSGTPTLGNVGTYDGITISVSDGTSSSSLSAFSVTVTQVSLGSATLSWTAPTQNDDGSVLTDLAGYKIYYGTATGSYQNTVRIDNPGLVTYVVDNLTPDTYYFVSTAFNSNGVESVFSNEAVKTVN